MRLPTIGAMALALSLAALPATANTTKREDGRLAVSSCYAQCAVDLAAEARKFNFRMDTWSRWLASSDYFDLTDQSQDNMFDTYLETYCLDLRSRFFEAQSCRAGCQDIEAVYGTRSGSARVNFNRQFNGLAAFYRRQEDGACAEYLSNSASAGRKLASPSKAVLEAIERQP